MRERECMAGGKGGTYAEEGYFCANRNDEVDVLEKIALAVVGLAEAVCPEGAVGARSGHDEERTAGSAGEGRRWKSGGTGEDSRGRAVERQERGRREGLREGGHGGEEGRAVGCGTARVSEAKLKTKTVTVLPSGFSSQLCRNEKRLHG